jgi:hypothetical protein
MADLHIMTRSEKIKSIAFMTGKIEEDLEALRTWMNGLQSIAEDLDDEDLEDYLEQIANIHFYTREAVSRTK